MIFPANETSLTNNGFSHMFHAFSDDFPMIFLLKTSIYGDFHGFPPEGKRTMPRSPGGAWLSRHLGVSQLRARSQRPGRGAREGQRWASQAGGWQVENHGYMDVYGCIWLLLIIIIIIIIYIYMYTLWVFNIAMDNGPFIDGIPIKNGDFPWLY